MAEAKDSMKPAAGSATGLPTATRGDVADHDSADEAPDKVSFRKLWPIPALVLAVAALGGGMYSVISQRPKADPSVPLVEAEGLVQDGHHHEAIELLNGSVLAFLDSGTASAEQRRRFFLARARAFAAAQAELGISREENHQRIIADFAEAETLGAALEPDDQGAVVESLIATGEIDPALRRIAALGEGQRSRKLRLTRLLVERNMAAQRPEERRDDLTLDLLGRMATEGDLPPDDRAWVLAKQTELLLSLRRVEDAITKLLRELQRMREVPPEKRGELYVLLGRAYVEAGQSQNAARQLEAADKLLDAGSLLRADAAVLLGRIAQATGEAGLESARERYALVVSEFRSSRAYLPAVLGLAEVEGVSRELERSLERYAELSEAIARDDPSPPPQAGREAVTASLMARHGELTEAGEHQPALRFAHLAEGMYAPAAVPPELLLALGRTGRTLADEAMDAARADHPADFTVRDLDPATRAEVKRHYLAAGDYFKRHAEQVSATDTVQFALSLWTAADSFERAGDLEEARKAFSLYADGAAETDPNRPAAKFRLAQIFQALGDYGAAIAIYEELRTGTGDERQPSAAGSWADRSVVPLALCYLCDADPDNDGRAETLLTGVVDGTALSPDARDYREALIELGNMYYAAGRFPDAIARLEEVVDRYASDGAQVGAPPATGMAPGRLEAIRFKLADSHRLEAGKIARTLQQALPQTVENELRAARFEHLRAATGLYERVRADLETADAARMPELEKTFLRNACFYIGDCAFDLGDHPRAVAAYDAAALKYVDDPASLVAMVQIVNTYVAQGQFAQARTANERARRQLARFPDEVWNRPDLPMEKKHWERWLEARQSLDQTAGAGGG